MLKGRGMGTLFVIVAPCFRENVVATCKIVSFLCSLDNLLQKNVIVFSIGNQIYSYQLSIHMYRYHHDLLPPGLPNNHFPTQGNIHDYYTRQANDLHVDPTNTELVKIICPGSLDLEQTKFKI